MMHFTIKKQLKDHDKTNKLHTSRYSMVSSQRHQAPIMLAHFQLSLGEQKFIQCLNSLLPAHHWSSSSCPGTPCEPSQPGCSLYPKTKGCTYSSQVQLGVKEWLALCPNEAQYFAAWLQGSGTSMTVSSSRDIVFPLRAQSLLSTQFARQKSNVCVQEGSTLSAV